MLPWQVAEYCDVVHTVGIVPIEFPPMTFFWCFLPSSSSSSMKTIENIIAIIIIIIKINKKRGNKSRNYSIKLMKYQITNHEMIFM